MEATLGQYLASIRADRKMTLREVEEATNKQVSNAYLSQIENNKIRKPSPMSYIHLQKFTPLDLKNSWIWPGT